MFFNKEISTVGQPAETPPSRPARGLSTANPLIDFRFYLDHHLAAASKLAGRNIWLAEGGRGKNSDDAKLAEDVYNYQRAYDLVQLARRATMADQQGTSPSAPRSVLSNVMDAIRHTPLESELASALTPDELLRLNNAIETLRHFEHKLGQVKPDR